MLEAAPHAAYCLPLPEQADSTADTRELDHLLATLLRLVGRPGGQPHARVNLFTCLPRGARLSSTR